MSGHMYLMDNNCLQDAITNTNEMLKTCPTNEPWRHDILKKHFQALIECQNKRSKLVVYNIDEDATREER